MQHEIEIVLRIKGTKKTLVTPFGTTLREALLAGGMSPYLGKNSLLNCRGMGICGTCLVTVWDETGPKEKRSCQIQCFKPMEIELQ